MNYVRLKKNTDFQKLFRRGKRVFSPCITLLYVPSDRQIMGIALSKKHGKAVKRNRIKRLIRAAYDKNVAILSENFSIVVMPKVQEEYSFEEIEKSLLTCFKRLNSQCRN
ncbi:MAG: ribonuclease P protein component [Candidatus Coproplasma sp.]